MIDRYNGVEKDPEGVYVLHDTHKAREKMWASIADRHRIEATEATEALEQCQVERDLHKEEAAAFYMVLKAVRIDLEERAKMNNWARVEDPELFFSTLGHTEDGGFVVALGSTVYWQLCEALGGFTNGNG